MKKTILTLMAALAWPAMGANYTVVPNWASVPTGEKQIGSMHGDVAVSSKGEVYVSVQAGPKAGVQVFSAEGKYLRNVPNAPPDFMGSSSKSRMTASSFMARGWAGRSS